MCFQLYAATMNALPRRKWEVGSSELPVESLSEQEAPIRSRFSYPEVQRIGSTTGCGCDFPHLMFQNGGWPFVEDPGIDEEQAESDRVNREGLFNILRASGETTVELYGIWDNGSFDKASEACEEIPLEAVLMPDFQFKEWGFYKVQIK
jgi:hypothetical protein